MDDVFEDDREKQTCTLNEYLDDVEERELVYFLVIYLFFLHFTNFVRVFEFSSCMILIWFAEELDWEFIFIF